KDVVSKSLLVISVVGLIVLGIVIIAVISRGRKREANNIRSELIGVPDKKQPAIPDAILEDMESITGRKEIRLFKKEMTVGRAVDVGKPSVDIAIPQNTVSALHATIEYRDNSFFVIDCRSTNKTYLNNQVLPSDIEQRLKSGDIITFDKYKFRLIIKEQTGKSGTVLRPAAAGGTIIRPKGAPPEPNHLPPTSEAGLPQYAQSDKVERETRLKPNVCEIHPSYKATEFCPVCKKGYCTECMIEKDGKKICRTCAS
ncbi:MAG: FHA domain-containing protein, partial [Proteobacteria bacterium]|nr:FHA domain-containing protein [Pseudomonadota bacterium]